MTVYGLVKGRSHVLLPAVAEKRTFKALSVRTVQGQVHAAYGLDFRERSLCSVVHKRRMTYEGPAVGSTLGQQLLRPTRSARASFLLTFSKVICFTLLDNRRYQREHRCVMQCNGRLAVNSTPIPYRGLGIALRFTSKSYTRRADERTRTADLISLRVCLNTFQPVLVCPLICLIYAVFGVPEPI
jgi:hypothetical protein